MVVQMLAVLGHLLMPKAPTFAEIGLQRCLDKVMNKTGQDENWNMNPSIDTIKMHVLVYMIWFEYMD